MQAIKVSKLKSHLHKEKEEHIHKGDRLYFKGKYGLYHEVTVRSIQGDYAYVIGGFGFGRQKVRIDKLFKQPSNEYQKLSKHVEEEACKAQEILWEFRESRIK
ncbi:hypothetical protein HBE96_00315 [Clostridium sp. P21]|uniref:Uncharacterized protein n=1 Tax=Clostridium muellerianum TaxID=2716538 RepID=A0A7Y0HLF3_9CLOT|nr:hypothetical protein [Clostridium muellerianum]NMM61170.1 hypothetical protein [Clostridium muellerianum]